MYCPDYFTIVAVHTNRDSTLQRPKAGENHFFFLRKTGNKYFATGQENTTGFHTDCSFFLTASMARERKIHF